MLPKYAVFSDLVFSNNTVVLSGQVNGSGEVWLGGGAVWLSGGDSSSGGVNVTVQRCTFVDNSAFLQGEYLTCVGYVAASVTALQGIKRRS